MDQGESEELEYKTRRNRIGTPRWHPAPSRDPKIRALGWDIVPFKTAARKSEHDAAKI